MISLQITPSAISQQFPTTANLKDYRLVRYNTHSDIYIKTIVEGPGQILHIAVKSLRVLKRNDLRIHQWIPVIQTLNTQSLNHRLAHDNLEPFRIVYITNMGISLPAIVTSWYENKDVLEYIRRNPEVDKLAMAYQTASALCYLHGQGIVHGNIYPGNIMVTDEGTIRVTDVGLNTLTIQHMHHDYVPVPVAWVYKSPEELSDGTHSIQTDVYSFGSTVYAMYALCPPYRPTITAKGIIEIITVGNRQMFEQSQHTSMSIGIWEMIQSCWELELQQRPTMAKVFRFIQSEL